MVFLNPFFVRIAHFSLQKIHFYPIFPKNLNFWTHFFRKRAFSPIVPYLFAKKCIFSKKTRFHVFITLSFRKLHFKFLFWTLPLKNIFYHFLGNLIFHIINSPFWTLPFKNLHFYPIFLKTSIFNPFFLSPLFPSKNFIFIPFFPKNLIFGHSFSEKGHFPPFYYAYLSQNAFFLKK